ncbi:MAG: ABC transporter permease [Mesorhizobium sp.]|uniref:ABC transporter permease n=1 Tax=Mesorhizobium sp. TaxID=1871066 RepID=UPI001AC2AB5D|nr:ABC transporter permease [Mesorhizobium sp.]MBN9217284.1 ABC transporter permease [Mesorhizobium sp.]
MNRAANRRVLAHYGYLAVPLGLFIVLTILAAMRSPNLFTGTGLAGAVIVAAPLILCTLALTPIVMVGRGSVDLSIGPLMGFVNVTLVAWLTQGGFTHPLAIFAWAMGLGAAFQLLQALVILYVRVAPIIVSLSSYLVLTGVNLLIMPRAGGLAPDWMMAWGAGRSLLSPVTFVVIAALLLWAVFWRSTLHGHVRLTGADERMAYTSGVATEKVRIGAHLLGGVFAGLAAVCYTGLIASGDPTQGANYTLQAVTALVLGGASLSGGRGGAVGSVLGALNMFLVANLLATFHFEMISGAATKLAFGLILVVSLLANALTANRMSTR